MEPIKDHILDLAWRASFAGHLLPLAPMDFLNLDPTRPSRGLNNLRVFDPGGCFSKRYYHHMLYRADSKYHPQHLPERTILRIFSFRLFFALWTPLFEEPSSALEHAQNWTSMDINSKRTQWTPNGFAFLPVMEFTLLLLNLLPLECRIRNLDNTPWP
jgi:hypothetical protein